MEVTANQPPPFTLPLLFHFSDKETVEQTVACSDSEAKVDPEEEPPSKRFHYLTSSIKEKKHP